MPSKINKKNGGLEHNHEEKSRRRSSFTDNRPYHQNRVNKSQTGNRGTSICTKTKQQPQGALSKAFERGTKAWTTRAEEKKKAGASSHSLFPHCASQVVVSPPPWNRQQARDDDDDNDDNDDGLRLPDSILHQIRCRKRHQKNRIGTLGDVMR